MSGKTVANKKQVKKTAAEPVNSKNEVFAYSRYLRISPYKVRRVAKVIRHESPLRALEILKRLQHRGAGFLYQTIKSAVANAENNQKLPAAELRLSTLMVDEGPRMKRYQPRARGRMFGIIKRTCHITVGVGLSGGAS